MAHERVTSPPTGSPHTWRLAKLRRPPTPPSIEQLAALKRMSRLAEIAGKVTQRPHIPMLREDNARKGFFEASEFEAGSVLRSRATLAR